MRSKLVITGLLAGLACAAAGAGPLAAGPAPGPSLVGMTPIKTIKPARGLIDDPFDIDGAGSRLIYVDSDSGSTAELRVVDLARNGAELARIDLSKHTTTPVLVRALGGDSGGYFVVSRPAKGQPARGLLVDGTGALVRSFGPADEVALTRRDDGQWLVVTYASKQARGGKGGPRTQHTITVHPLDGSKKRPGNYDKPRVLVADEKGYIAALDYRINHWADGYTRVVGIKGGSWNAQEKQRSPDHEAWYDVVAGEFSKRVAITNLMEHTLLMQAWAGHSNETEFVAVSRDLAAVELVTPSGRRPLELAEPFRRYDHRTLEYQPAEDGRIFFTLAIDPLNPEAAARKRAEPAYLDLYEHRIGEPAARRRARLLLRDKRRHSWRAADGFWVLVPRLIGFDRGGTELQIYKLDRPAP